MQPCHLLSHLARLWKCGSRRGDQTIRDDQNQHQSGRCTPGDPALARSCRNAAVAGDRRRAGCVFLSGLIPPCGACSRSTVSSSRRCCIIASRQRTRSGLELAESRSQFNALAPHSPDILDVATHEIATIERSRQLQFLEFVEVRSPSDRILREGFGKTIACSWLFPGGRRALVKSSEMRCRT